MRVFFNVSREHFLMYLNLRRKKKPLHYLLLKLAPLTERWHILFFFFFFTAASIVIFDIHFPFDVKRDLRAMALQTPCSFTFKVCTRAARAFSFSDTRREQWHVCINDERNEQLFTLTNILITDDTTMNKFKVSRKPLF